MGRVPRRLGRAGLAVLALVAVLVGVGLGLLVASGARSDAGPACTKSWAAATSGDWTDAAKWSPAGVPAATDDVCVTVAGTYTVTQSADATVHSVQVGASSGSGIASLVVRGVGCSNDTTLTVSTSTDISAHGHLSLTSGGCGGAISSLVGTGTVTNAGTLDTLAGTGGARVLRAPVVNTGTIDVTVATTYDAATTLDNRGALDLSGVLTASGSSTIIGRSGAITSSGTGALDVVGATFQQRGGTTAGPNPVLVRNSTLADLGTGSPAAFSLQQNVTLSGNVAAGQTLAVEGVGCSYDTTVTVSGDLANAGTIRETASGCGSASAFVTGSGTLANSGTFASQAGTGGGRFLRMSLDNTGTVLVDQRLDADVATETLTNAGTISLTQPMVVSGGTITGASGAIDATGAGLLTAISGATFTEEAGAVTGTPVEVRNATLAFSGPSSATTAFTLHQAVSLSGDVPAGATLEAEGLGCSYDTTVTTLGAFTNAGTIDERSGGCGTATVVLDGTGLLTNRGHLTTSAGTGGARYVRLSVRNTGTVEVDQPLSYDQAGATFTNQGTLTLAQALTVSGGEVANASGSIDATGSGVLSMQSGTFTQSAGSVSGTAVEIRNATLAFTGSADPASSFLLHQAVTLTGDVPAASRLVFEGLGCSYDTTVTTSAAFTNRGSIVERSGGCGTATVVLALGGTLANAGTLDVEAGTGGARYVRGSVVNTGTVEVAQPLTYDQAGSTFTNEGTVSLTAAMTVSSAEVRDVSGTIDATGSGALSVQTGTFTQIGGTVSATAVEIRNSTLAFAGVGDPNTTFVLHQAVTLTGDVPVNTTVIAEGLGCSYDTTVSTTAGFTNEGTIVERSGGCGTATVVLALGGTLANAGTLDVEAGTGGARYVRGSVVNTGTVQVAQPLTYDQSGSTFTNEGTVSLTQPMTVDAGTVRNESGSITATGSGSLSVQGGTFDQSGGATSGTAIEIRNSTLAFGGTAGAGSGFVLHQSVSLSGDIPAGAAVTVEGVGCSYDTTVTATAGFTNAGTITVTSAGCGAAASHLVVPGPLRDTGTIVAAPGTGGSHQITTPTLDDQGTLRLLPGDPLALAGDLDVGPTGTLQVGVDPGANGHIDVTGTATLEGTLLTDTSFTPTYGQTFGVATYGSESGTFAGTGTTGTQYDVGYGPTALTLSVLKAASASLAAGPAGPTVTGQSVTFTATVAVVAPDTGTPTGSVDFLDGTTVIGTATLDGSQHATFTTESLLPGTHEITAEYLGAATFGHSTSSAVTRVVDRGVTTASLSSGPDPSDAGDLVTFTATVAVSAPGTGHPSGTVTFEEGSTVLGTGTLDLTGRASTQTSALHVGSHSITATYAGDSRYLGSTSPAATQVVTGVAVATSTDLSVPTSVVASQPVQVVATVTVEPPATDQASGTVDFLGDGGALLGSSSVGSDGTATFRLSTGFTPGTHTIQAAYEGTPTLDASTSPARDVVVDHARATLAVTPILDPEHPGVVRFEVVANPVAPATLVPSGPVVLEDGTVVVGRAELAGGRTTLSNCFTAACAPPPTTTTTTPTTTSTTTTPPTSTSTTTTPPTSTSTTTTTEVPTTSTSTTSSTTTTSAPIVVDRAAGLTLVAHAVPAAPVAPPPATSAASIHQVVASYAGDGNFAGFDSPAIPVSVDGDTVTLPGTVTTTTTSTTTPPTTTPATTPTTTPTTAPVTTVPATTQPGPVPTTTAPAGSAAGGSRVTGTGTGAGSTTGATSTGSATGGSVAAGATTGATIPGGVGAADPRIGSSLGSSSGTSGGDAGLAAGDSRGIDDSPQAAAARFGRSTLAQSVADPHHVRTDVTFVLANLALTLVLVLLIAFPAHMFNNTLAENYDEVLGWFGPIQLRLDGLRSLRGQVPTPIVLGAMSIAGSFLFALLDPNFGFNQASLALVLGLLAALVIVSSVYDVARARYLRAHYGISSNVRGYPAGLAVAVVLVAFSRIAHFTPGYLFGVFTALGFNEEVDEREDGKGLAVAAAWLLAVAVLCWVLWAPVSAAAVGGSPSFAVLFLDAALSTIWIAGVQGIIFGMLPLRFLDGLKVLRWSRAGWALLYGLGMFAFVHTMLRPGTADQGSRSFLPALLVFVGFTLVSVVFWAYFRFRTPPPDGPDGPDGPPPTSDGEPVLVDA